MSTHPYFEKFKILEAKLRKISHGVDRNNFYEVLDKAEKINYLIKIKRSVLLDLNALRNIFAHADREKYIAEVNQFAFEELDKIINSLENPPTVGKVFKKDVYYVDTNEIVEIVIRKMQENIYTHVPVYKDDKYIGTFSETTLLTWLIHNLNKGHADFYKPQIKYVNPEYLNNSTNMVKFIPADKSIFEIHEMFDRAISVHARLGALLITEDGTKNKFPIGIITAWDLPIIDGYIR